MNDHDNVTGTDDRHPIGKKASVDSKSSVTQNGVKDNAGDNGDVDADGDVNDDTSSMAAMMGFTDFAKGKNK